MSKAFFTTLLLIDDKHFIEDGINLWYNPWHTGKKNKREKRSCVLRYHLTQYFFLYFTRKNILIRLADRESCSSNAHALCLERRAV